MDKDKVASILASYSPPLSQSQIDIVSTEISRIQKMKLPRQSKKPKLRQQSPHGDHSHVMTVLNWTNWAAR